MKPTPEQLTLIRPYFSADSPELSDEALAEKLNIQTFIVADNLVNFDLGRWGMNSLERIPQILPGTKLMCDHDWEEVHKIIGVIFDARLIKISQPPNWVLNAGGEKEENLGIINEEGYWRVEADVYFSAEKTEIIKKLELGEWDSVSLTFNYFDPTDYQCPICKIKLSDSECPHILKSEKPFFPSKTPTVGHYIKPLVKIIMETSIVYKGLSPAVGLRTKRYTTT